jgi:hypothetical protein
VILKGGFTITLEACQEKGGFMKDTNATRTTDPETSRRRFLKTGAAIAGAAILGEVFNQAIVSAADKNRPDLENVQLLFVQNAKDVVVKGDRLTLKWVSPTTIFFSDRPKRITGHMHTKEFVSEWQKGTGKESFHTDPPNAVLSIFTEDEIVDVVLTLKNPSMVGGSLIYEVNVLDQDGPIPSGPASLFIDPIGMPLTPVSYAGVARRSGRGDAERAVVLY